MVTGFKVYEGDGDTELSLIDEKTTIETFNFGETIPLIRVTKDGYTEAHKTNYTIIDGDNSISVDMPIEVVSQKWYF